MTNVVHEEGTILLSVVEEESFADEEATVFVAQDQKPASEAKDNELKVVLKNLPNGDVAVQIHHDLNDNLKMEKNFVGMPKEPWGMSRDAPARFGPPQWDKAKIELTDEPQEIKIKLR